MEVHLADCRIGCVHIMSFLAVMVGCTADGLRTDPSDQDLPIRTERTVQLIDDLARPWGNKYIRVEGVSLVVGLAGTGGDPQPSSERDMLMDEMLARDVDKPNQVLASSNTALVAVRAFLPPGVRKGDPVDVEVYVPRRNNTASLRGGWLMRTRLREYARLDGRVASGHDIALAEGNVLIDALIEGDEDPVNLTRGRVLGGGVATKSRELGLVVRDEHLSVQTSARIVAAVNKRFHTYDRGIQRPVATPKRNRFVEILVHPRYQDNVIRYLRVIQSVPVREGEQGLPARLKSLRTQLMYAATSPAAALQLEALGDDGLPALRDAIVANDEEVQFYAAEALAYMNDPLSVPVLVRTIRREPAFRWRAFTALGAVDDAKAHEALASLLHTESAETRYGAFRALRKLIPDDPLISGQVLGDQFHYHVVSTTSSPLVHVTRSERPEIVLFGSAQRLRPPVVLYAGRHIVVRSEGKRLSATRFTAGEDDQNVECSCDLDNMIQAIVDLGGTYPDVVQAITQAKSHGCLDSRVEFAALPTTGRTYYRRSKQTDDIAESRKSADSTQAAPSSKLRGAGWNGRAGSSTARLGTRPVAEVTLSDADDLIGEEDFDDDALLRELMSEEPSAPAPVYNGARSNAPLTTP